MKFGFKLIEHGLAVSVAGHLWSVVKKGVFHFLLIWSKGRARVHFARVWLMKYPLTVEKIGECFEVR